MAEFILKDWYGKDCRFDHDKIFVQDANGELVQFTQGKGNPVLEELRVAENGLYTPKGTVDGFNRVVVDVASEINEMLFNKTNFSGFASGDEFNGLHTKTLIVGTDIDSLKIIDGREYTVYWDDVNYTTYAKDTNYIIEEAVGGETIYRSIYYLGNGTLLGLNGAEDTGEPFALQYTQSKELLLVSTDTAETHSVAIMKRVRPRDGLEMMLQSLTVTENGTYTADSFYDGLKQVVVDVAGASADLRYVTFMSHDGTIEYGKKAVAVGDDCADPIARGIFSTPTRESDAQYDYTHNGWSTEVNSSANSNWNKAITEDKTVYAGFKASYIYYTVTFYDDDNTTVLSTKSVTYGTDASYTPEKAGYKFVGWSADVTNVTTNMEVYAVWQIDDGYIHDSWETVVARAQDGTASNYYSVGDKIVLPLSYTDGTTEEVDLHLVAFNDGSMEDGNACNIAFVCAEALKTLCAFSTVSLSSSRLTSALWNTNLVVYNHLLNVVLPALPSVLRDNIKVRDMAYSAAPNLKLWLPEEDDFKGLTNRNTCIDIRSAFPDANSRIMYKTDGTGPVEWWTGTPKWTYSYYWGTGYGTDGELLGDSRGYISENPPSTPRGVVFGFCI